MSYGLEMCSSFATVAVVRGYVELSVPCAVTVLVSRVEIHFNNIGPFLIRPVVFAHLRAPYHTEHLLLVLGFININSHYDFSSSKRMTFLFFQYLVSGVVFVVDKAVTR
jgi:hypothetical protein